MKTIKIPVGEFSFYCSPMPFSHFDPDGMLLREYKDSNISWVVILSSLQKIMGKCVKDLFLAYQEAHINTLFFPFNDYLASEKAEQVRLVVPLVGKMVKEGRGVVIHCLSCRVVRMYHRMRYDPQKIFGDCVFQLRFWYQFCDQRDNNREWTHKDFLKRYADAREIGCTVEQLENNYQGEM